MTANKRHEGLKRHASLRILSHEHHHGLVFCQRLKRTGHVEKEMIQDFARDFWDTHLKQHMEQEEEEILPVLTDKSLERKFLGEHRNIRYLFWKIDNQCGDKYEEAQELSSVLSDHIRFEERELFPFLETSIPDKLAQISSALSREATSHAFEPKFWENENKQ